MVPLGGHAPLAFANIAVSGGWINAIFQGYGGNY